MSASALPSAALCKGCDPEDVPFATTAQARDLSELVGQERAIDAVHFGIGIRRSGYNLFAMGPPGIGKQTLLRQLLEDAAAAEPAPSDWCYVHNFADPHRPRALELPAGLGAQLRAGMERAIAELQVAMHAAFESDEYRTRKQQLMARFKKRQEEAFAEVQERARQRRVAIVRTDEGVILSLMRDGATLEPTVFHALPEQEKAQLQAELERVGTELQALFGQFHEWGRQHYHAMKALDREVAAGVAHHVIEALRVPFATLPAVVAYLTEVEADVIDHADDFLDGSAEGIDAALKNALRPEAAEAPTFRRYAVSLIIDNAGPKGVPVTYEDNPTFASLVGRIDHVSRFGALSTDLTLLKPGALHRARGGYLLLDALRVLQRPFAWEALKRAIQAREIRLESVPDLVGVIPTASLEPAPIPLGDTKIVLLGDRSLYYLLAALDPDVAELFKVVVDFEDTLDRRPEAQRLYATLVATLVHKEGLRPFDRSAVARVIEHAARLAADAEKLSMRMRPIVDLLREADFCAARAERAGRDVVTAADVQAAIDAQVHRAGRLRERLLEETRRGSILIETAGARVGQVNGLAVVQLGEFAFGHPTRITARVRVGRGEVVDIEREVEMGGPIHSKGVLILSGFVGARYTPRVPLSLSASVVFEQSYGGVEGDSASLAELCALLSALAELPLRQALAVTGSVNQHGQVQAIGGVNEKIEGFFDLCRDRGLTGAEGVLIPTSNVKNLMLRSDVVQAVARGQFNVYAVSHVDEALELLTGRPAGAIDERGRFPSGSVNALVEARLLGFAESVRAFASRLPEPR